MCNKVNAARNLCVAIRESSLGSVGDMWQLTILVEASALVSLSLSTAFFLDIVYILCCFIQMIILYDTNTGKSREAQAG